MLLRFPSTMASLAMTGWRGSRQTQSTISPDLISPDQLQRKLLVQLCSKTANEIRVFTGQNLAKKTGINRRTSKHVKLQPPKRHLENVDDLVADSNRVSFSETSNENSSVRIPSRKTVLKACTLTSGVITTLAIIIRQVSHFAATKGWPVVDCSIEVSFGFETWHLELIAGLVILISSCRYTLTMMWPEFAKSSEVANRQVLSSLEPFDYVTVAVLPGVSEELLFRGALVPLFGVDWKSVLGVAAVFGLLHLGSGRTYAFAVWATFVGLVYGYATIISSNLLVPMASHALNNLIGAILWRSSLMSSK